MLVEGTSGVGKSTVIDALIRRHVDGAVPRKIRSLTHLAQTHTYGPLAPAEDCGTLTVAQNCVHLERIVATLEWLHDAHEHSPVPSFAIVDTLHLTHCLRPGIVAWPDVEPYDRRLAAIGCKLLLLTAERETLRARSIEARIGQQFLEEYARKFGRTNDEILDHFVAEQRKFTTLSGCSAMQTLTLDAGVPSGNASARAYAFWHS